MGLHEKKIELEEKYREQLGRSGDSSGILFWIGGVGLLGTIWASWSGGESGFTTGVGIAASIGVLIWAVVNKDKATSENRKLEAMRYELEIINKQIENEGH